MSRDLFASADRHTYSDRRPHFDFRSAPLMGATVQFMVLIHPSSREPGLSSGPRETRAPRGRQCVRGRYVMFVSEFDQASTSCLAWSFARPYRS
jgi:hypothetical protein